MTGSKCEVGADAFIGRPGRALVMVHGFKNTEFGLHCHASLLDFDNDTDAAYLHDDYDMGYWVKTHTPIRREGWYVIEGAYIKDQITGAPDLLDGEVRNIWAFTGIRAAMPSEVDEHSLSTWHLACGLLPPLDTLVEVTTSYFGKNRITQAMRISWCGSWEWKTDAIDLQMLEKAKTTAWRPLCEEIPYDGPTAYLKFEELVGSEQERDVDAPVVGVADDD